MMEGALIAFVIVCFCGFIMWAVALWSLKKRRPCIFGQELLCRKKRSLM